MTTESAPLQPKSVLRGHRAQVHAAAFIRHNDRLVTGDADGFVVVWDLTIMRPRAVWKAHTSAILGIRGWDDDKIITHGRDNRLVVWKLRVQDEASLSTQLPLDASPEEQPQPWVLYLLEVNTMNFCTFSCCHTTTNSPEETSGLLIAVPNTLASESIDIFHLPSQQRQHTVSLGHKNGMVMALSLFYIQSTPVLIAAYETGQVVVAQLNGEQGWDVTYRATSHTQPILSLDVAPNKEYFLTSSADAVIAKHPIPQASDDEAQLAESVRIPEGKTPVNPSGSQSLLSAALASVSQEPPPPSISKKVIQAHTGPLKVIDTRHSGQQSLKIRSDSRIFATAGWDSKIRIYSVKTMKEVAVLKWHQVGCYAVAFSTLEQRGGGRTSNEIMPSTEGNTPFNTGDSVVPRLVGTTVREKRIMHAKSAHWLAAGSKDGKVSLWDVF